MALDLLERVPDHLLHGHPARDDRVSHGRDDPVTRHVSTLSNLMKIAIAVEPFDSPDARRLVGALDEHLASRYAPEQRFGPHLKAEHVAPGVGTFVIARADGQAVGCGALRRRDASTVEVKRMYVEPEMRGRGVASGILDHLEAAARSMGAERLVLETGIYQEEAIGLYRGAGFKAIDCFEEYAGVPTSVCFEKPL
jgi:GNAT superfamily N-acetyltransferase